MPGATILDAFNAAAGLARQGAGMLAKEKKYELDTKLYEQSIKLQQLQDELAADYLRPAPDGSRPFQDSPEKYRDYMQRRLAEWRREADAAGNGSRYYADSLDRLDAQGQTAMGQRAIAAESLAARQRGEAAFEERFNLAANKTGISGGDKIRELDGVVSGALSENVLNPADEAAWKAKARQTVLLQESAWKPEAYKGAADPVAQIGADIERLFANPEFAAVPGLEKVQAATKEQWAQNAQRENMERIEGEQTLFRDALDRGNRPLAALIAARNDGEKKLAIQPGNTKYAHEDKARIERFFIMPEEKAASGGAGGGGGSGGARGAAPTEDWLKSLAGDIAQHWNYMQEAAGGRAGVNAAGGAIPEGLSYGEAFQAARDAAVNSGRETVTRYGQDGKPAEYGFDYTYQLMRKVDDYLWKAVTDKTGLHGPGLQALEGFAGLMRGVEDKNSPFKDFAGATGLGIGQIKTQAFEAMLNAAGEYSREAAGKNEAGQKAAYERFERTVKNISNFYTSKTMANLFGDEKAGTESRLKQGRADGNRRELAAMLGKAEAGELAGVIAAAGRYGNAAESGAATNDTVAAMRRMQADTAKQYFPGLRAAGEQQDGIETFTDGKDEYRLGEGPGGGLQLKMKRGDKWVPKAELGYGAWAATDENGRVKEARDSNGAAIERERVLERLGKGMRDAESELMKAILNRETGKAAYYRGEMRRVRSEAGRIRSLPTDVFKRELFSGLGYIDITAAEPIAPYRPPAHRIPDGLDRGRGK